MNNKKYLDGNSIDVFEEFITEVIEELGGKTTRLKNKDDVYDALLKAVDKYPIFLLLPRLKEYLYISINLAKDETPVSLNKHDQKAKARLPHVVEALKRWNLEMSKKYPKQCVGYKIYLEKIAEKNNLASQSIRELEGIERFKLDVARRIELPKKATDDWLANNPRAKSLIKQLRPSLLTVNLDKKKQNAIQKMVANLM